MEKSPGAGKSSQLAGKVSQMAEEITRPKNEGTLPEPGAILMVFAKAPVDGRVKTRLARVVGSPAAAALHKAFAADLLQVFTKTGYPLRVYYWPPATRSAMRAWLGTGYPLFAQAGNDLGERMASAFSSAFSSGFEKAVLVGTDFPDLPASHIHAAFSSLSAGSAVIGPARDGGYLLLGFRREGFLPDVFRGIAWGTPEVLDKTAAVFRQRGQPVHYLPAWWDVDTPADLYGLARRLARQDSGCAPETRRILKTLGYLKD
jgi:hypothetical protein